MAVKHAFTSAKADGADATLVRPSDWNANHTIDNDTITYAMIQNITATQRLLGRNTAGAGDTEEVTASQLLDWVSTTRGVLLYRGAATWAALSPGTAGFVLTSNGAGADPSYQAPAATATTFEQNLGSASWRGSFTLTDAAITSSKKIHIWQAPGPYTNKGTRADEAEMVRILATAEPGTGSALIRWETLPITTSAADVNHAASQASHTHNPNSITRRLNKARGNFKFTYVIYS